MKPPIVIVEGHDVSVHPSPEHAATYLEPRDVNDGVYVAYDSEGWLLDLNVKRVKREHHFLWFRWVVSYQGVVLSEHEPATDGSAELRRKLVEYLNLISKKKPEGELPTASLDQLIQAAGRYMPWRVSPRDA
jgi:hypothetical protein